MGTDWSIRGDWKTRRDRILAVPGELLSLYQPVIGAQATLAWLNLSYLVQQVQVIPDPVRELQVRQGLTEQEARDAINRLISVRLLEPSAEGGLVLKEPAARGELARRGDEAVIFAQPDETAPAPYAPGSAAAARAGTALEQEERGSGAAQRAAQPARPAGQASREAMQAVVDFYHKRIGLLGPVQYEKLRFWVEEKGMSPDVVAVAIEETAASAENPRIQYLEGILRNWYNDGVRTMQDLVRQRSLPKALGGDGIGLGAAGSERGAVRSLGAAQARRGSKEEAIPESNEGLPNAAAYQRVDPEEIRRWKALHPEEYDQ